MLELFAGFGDREALVREDQRFTYAELRAAVLNMAGAMHRHGIRPGTMPDAMPGATVVVLVDRPIEAPILQLALHALGARTVWIDLEAERRDLGEYLRMVHPSSCATTRGRWPSRAGSSPAG